MEQTLGNNKWTLKNIITLGVFTVIMIILMMIVTVIMNLVLTPVGSYYASPGIAALLCGPFYMVLADKIGKRGVLFFVCLIPGIMFTLMGQFYSGIVYLVLGLVGELCMLGKDAYHRFGRNLLGFFIFMLAWSGGGIFPMIFFRQQYLDWYMSYSNGDTAAVQVMIDTYGSPLGITACVVLTAVGCVIGGLIGRAILNRHVKKARI